MSFQRPGTAYGSAAFKDAAMSSTASSFYGTKGAASKGVKPVDKAKASNKSAAEVKNSSLSTLWITRAEKILDQIEHLQSLLEFIEYGCNACDRQLNTYKPRLQKN